MSRFGLELPAEIDSQHLVEVLNDRLRRIGRILDSGTVSAAPEYRAAAGLIPGDVTIRVSEITKSYFTDPTDGVWKVKISIPCTAPLARDFHGFAGVQAYLETPYQDAEDPLDPTDGWVQDCGWQYFGGLPVGKFTVTLIIPSPARQEKWRFYLPSRTLDYSNPLILSTKPNPSPNVLVTIDPSAAINVENFDVGEASYGEGDRLLIIPFGFTLPSGDDWESLDWSRMVIEIKTSSMAENDQAIQAAVFDTNTGSPGDAVQSQLQIGDLPPAEETWTLSAVSYDTRGNRYLGAPTDTVTVGPPSHSGGQPDPVTQLAAVIAEYGMDEAGNHVARVHVSYFESDDSDDQTCYLFWVAETATNITTAPDPTEAVHNATTRGDCIDIWFTRPQPGEDTVRKWIYVVTNDEGWGAPPDADSPVVYVDVPAATEPSQVTGFSVTIVDAGANAPNPSYHWKYDFTKPTDPEFWYAQVEYIKCDSGFNPVAGWEWSVTMGIVDPPGEHAEWWPYPQSAEYYKIRCRSFARSGLSNDSSIPTVNVTVDATSGLRLFKADAATYNTTELEIVGGKFQLKEVPLSKAGAFNTDDFEIAAGPEFRYKILDMDRATVGTLVVGGGAAERVGQVAVRDASNNLVTWAGVNGGYYGLWGKKIWAGGTSPANAPFYVDASGHVAIDNAGSGYRATFKLSLNNITTEIANAWDAAPGAYAGLRLWANAYPARRIGLYPFASSVWVEDDATHRSVLTGIPSLGMYSGANTLMINGFAGYIDVWEDYRVDGVKVVGNQQSALADLSWSGWATADLTYNSVERGMLNDLVYVVETTKDKVNAILAAMRTHGLIAT